MNLHMPLDDITEETLKELVGISESRFLEFKRELVGRRDDDIKEFAKDVVAFANTGGGHLIYGMEEENGTATNLIGLVVNNVDEECLRLENIMRSNIEPPIFGHHVHPVRQGEHRLSIVIRVPQSWTGPHRTNYKNSRRFYRRNSSAAYEPDMIELRDMFMASSMMSDRLKNFRLERYDAILASSIVRLAEKGAIALHIVPFSVMGTSTQIDTRQVYGMADQFVAATTTLNGRHYSFDGVVTQEAAEVAGLSVAYTCVFRNGSLESVLGGIIREGQPTGVISAARLERFILDSIPRFVSSLAKLQMSPPYAVLVTLINIHTAKLGYRRGGYNELTRGVCDRPTLMIPPAMIETDRLEGEWHKVMRPVLDQLWNAFGEDGSPFFGERGNWSPPA